MSTINPEQSPKTAVKPAVQKKPLTPVERIAALEEKSQELEATMAQVAMMVDENLKKMRMQFSGIAEVVNALIAIEGDDMVEATMTANKVAMAQQAADARKQAVVQKLETGDLVAEAEIRNCKTSEDGKTLLDPGSFVATEEYQPNGEVVPGSYHCLPMSNVRTEFRERMTGKNVGYEVGSSEKQMIDGVEKEGKVIVLGIYKAMPPKPPQAPAEAPAVPDVTAETIPAPAPASDPAAAPSAQ